MTRTLERIASVMDGTGLARPTIYRDISRGLFPHPVKIGTASAWPSNEVAAIIDARIAGKSNDDIRELVAKLEGQRTASS